jgi:uncharacterized protein
MKRRSKPLALTALAIAVGLSMGKAEAETPSDAGTLAWIRHDYQTALRLLRPLAEQGDADAQLTLAAMYAAGDGVPQNYAEALRLYRLAANQGSPGAQHDLGVMYERGDGVPQNYVRAHMWYNVAISTKDPADVYISGIQANPRKAWVKDRDNIARQMTPEQIAAAQDMAQTCIGSRYLDCGD